MEIEIPERVPVFPLPEVVLFPSSVLPLHIFEPRYRQMVRDALEGDRLIVMALLKPGWEPEYEGTPEVFPLACLGRIERVQRFPDGRFNLTLAGLCRVELLQLFEDLPYRQARLRALPEAPPPGPRARKDLELRLLASYTALQQGLAGADAVAPLSLGSGVPFAVLVNSLCLHSEIDVYRKQGLLELPGSAPRCEALSRLLDDRLHEALARGEASGELPPGTRVN